MQGINNYSSLFAQYCIYFLDSFGISLAFPIFSTLILDPHFGNDLSMLPNSLRMISLGFLLASFPIAQFISWNLFAKWGERRSRKAILTVSSLGIGVGFFLMLIAINFNSYFFLITTRFFTGFCAGNFVLCMFPPTQLSTNAIQFYHKRLLHMSSCGFMIGILVGGVLSSKGLYPLFQLQTPIYFGAFFAVAISCITLYMLPSQSITGSSCLNWKNFHQTIFNKNYLNYFLIYCLFLLGYLSVLLSYSSFILRVFGPDHLFITFSLLLIVISYMIGFFPLHSVLKARFSQKSLLAFGFVITSLLSFLMFFIHHLFFTTFVHILFALSIGIIWASISGRLRSHELTTHYQLIAYKTVLMSFCSIVAPLATGFFGLLGPFAIYPFSTLCLFLGLIFTLKLN